MKSILKKILGKYYLLKFKIKEYGKNVYIGKGNYVLGGKNIVVGNNVSIRPECTFFCNEDAKIIINDGCDIGTRSRISCGKKILIGSNVLIGPNVYIADQDHEYKDITKPIIEQGVNTAENGIEIGEGSWFGINSVIVGNVKIGKNCVIGANAVVTKNVEDYSVVVGTPAKVVKKYNLEKEMWEKV